MFDPIQAALSPLDALTFQMEGKWGVGILPQLVSTPTREKFERAQQRLNEAIKTNDFDTIKGRADVLIKGWQKLDEEASQAGYDQDKIDVKIGRSTDGVEYVFCQDKITASRYAARHPSKASAILTFDQMADILDSKSVANKKVNNLLDKLTDSIKFHSSLDEILNDEIPF